MNLQPVPVVYSGLRTFICCKCGKRADQAHDTVFADHDALRRIVDNLLANAVRFTPGGGVIDVTACRDADTAVMTVTDSGAGFPSEFLPHAFERFRKADVARGGPEQAGSGLGLAIVREVAVRHGAHVAIRGGAGGAGTIVRVFFPPRGGDPAVGQEAPVR